MLFAFEMSESFREYAEILEMVLNHLEVVFMIATCAAFVYLACGVFPKGLAAILGPCGLTLRAKLRARFACRASRNAQRVFLEFALLKTEGRVLTAKEWNGLLDDFVTYMSTAKDLETPVFKISNCMYLTKAEFSDAVGRYFEYIARPRVKAFYSISKTSDFWISKIKIDEAYVMPAVLLSGLLARYEDNWEVFLAKYVSTASAGASGRGRTMLRELYNVFAWLLWGPSREICWQDGWDGLCQISYGDESNSLPAFVTMDGDVIGRMRDILAEKLAAGTFGCLFSVDVALAPKREFFRSARGHMVSANAYFVDKIAKDPDLDFVARITDFSECKDYRAHRYYCTAYLWTLFELDDPSDPAYHPETSVAFFEHANLANSDTCEFLVGTLLNKAVSHFRMVYDNEKTRVRKYRFVCGFYRDIEKRCRMRFAEEVAKGGDFGKWLGEAVSFDVRHEPTVVFASIDDFFGEADAAFSFKDVESSDRVALADLAVFYSGMYTEAFPVDDERESLANIIEYLRRSRTTKEWKFHVLLAKDDRGVIVGGAVFDYFVNTNSVVVEFIVVDAPQRTRGLGTTLFHEIVKTADDEAKAAGFKAIDYVFCEVESPETAAKNSKGLGHLHFWSGNWFRHLDFDYVQPPLGPGQDAVRGLWLLCAPRVSSAVTATPKVHENAASVPSKIVENVVRDYVHYSMSIEDPMEDPDFAAMKKQLAGMDFVKLNPII